MAGKMSLNLTMAQVILSIKKIGSPLMSLQKIQRSSYKI